ncbi:pentapeptide repeat-containing protein [Allocoleopsis sp.]|uniref:pentapeptide repeat-containing protein n=1 Tax=Allocoleopsis sp. TaxID=3088169 RepID=UPI002FD560A7
MPCPYQHPNPNAGKQPMRATEVLKQYADGRRDFSGENLKGQSFKGKDLSGANFSEADIRGANFTNAKLTGANFKRANAGLQRRWVMGLVIGSWLLAGLSGIFSGLATYFAGMLFDINSSENVFFGVTALVMLVIFLVVTTSQGLVKGIFALAVTFAVAGTFAIAIALTNTVAITFTGTGAIMSAGGGGFAAAGAATCAIAVTGTIAVSSMFASVLTGIIALAVSRVVAFVGAGHGAATMATIVTLLGAYVGWRAVTGDERDAWTLGNVIALAAIGGTSFRHADLTDADFTSATLKHTDFRNATLTRTNLHQTQKLDLARVGNTIFIDTKVRDLVVTHRGAKQFYIGCNLKSANLVGSDLNDADLTEADISGANLQGAWLERANLTKTQALNTNFNQAHLTGACLEAWNIDSTTQLDGAICDYVYLLNNQQERRPNSGEFAPGEFTKLFQEVLTTVDLIFRNGIDWKAFVLSFNAVQAQNEGTELSLQSIENKGDGVVVARLNVSEDADKEKIHSDFMQSYELALKAVEETYKAKLNAKDNEIEIYRQKSSEMKEIVSLLASRPINVDVKAVADSKSMNESTDQSRNIRIGDINATGSSINLGDISGIVTNTINQLPPSPEPEKPGIKELLSQLQAAINDPNLADDDKQQVLEQIKVLAEAGQNPNKETAQKQAKRAMGFLKVIAEGLPSAAQLVKTCQDVLPAIALFFGL